MSVFTPPPHTHTLSHSVHLTVTLIPILFHADDYRLSSCLNLLKFVVGTGRPRTPDPPLDDSFRSPNCMNSETHKKSSSSSPDTAFGEKLIDGTMWNKILKDASVRQQLPHVFCFATFIRPCHTILSKSAICGGGATKHGLCYFLHSFILFWISNDSISKFPGSLSDSGVESEKESISQNHETLEISALPPPPPRPDPVPIKALDMAVKHVEEFLRHKSHEDIGETTSFPPHAVWIVVF